MNERQQEIASALPADLDQLPKLRGFRLRGLEMTRLETFIDATFAFAITILVIASGQPPEDVASLLAAFRNVPAFVASIAVMAIFWRGHWLWSRRYGLEDGVSILISWCMMVTILIYVYPMRMLFGAMFSFLSGHQLGHTLHMTSALEVRAIFAVYAIGFTATATEILLLNWRAWSLREPLRLNAWEGAMTRDEIRGWSVPVGVGLLSLLLALTLPLRYVDWSGWIYLCLGFLTPLSRWMHRRQRAGRSETLKG
jgi:hypothetical protein